MNSTSVAGVIALCMAVCLLRSGIVGHVQSGTAEWVAPDNYFVGLGTLFAGMGVVTLLLVRSDSHGIERKERPIGTSAN